jgi:hypothetical protein
VFFVNLFEQRSSDFKAAVSLPDKGVVLLAVM